MKNIILILFFTSCISSKQGVISVNEKVPTEEIAIKVAENYWKKDLNKNLYDDYVKVTLINNSVWYLFKQPKISDKQIYGGGFYMKIRKSDGKILDNGMIK